MDTKILAHESVLNHIDAICLGGGSGSLSTTDRQTVGTLLEILGEIRISEEHTRTSVKKQLDTYKRTFEGSGMFDAFAKAMDAI